MDHLRGIVSILGGGWKASPGRMTASAVLMLVQYVSWPLAPLALKEVTDAVVARDVESATIAAAVLPLIALIGYTGRRIAMTVWVELGDLHAIRLAQEMGALSQGPPGLEHHERADYADRIELIRTESNELFSSVRLALSALSLGVQIVITIVLLALVEPLLLLLLLFAVPQVAADRWAFRRLDAAQLATADRARLGTHLFDLTVRQDAAKEIRLFGLQDELARRLREARREVRRRVVRAESEGVVVLAAGQLVFALGFVGGLVLVVRGAIEGRSSVGDVVLVVTLASRVSSLLFEVVGVGQWLQLSTKAMARMAWLRRLVADLYPVARRDAPVPERVRDGLRFEGVGFRYPGTETDVLREVDLSLPAGTTVALVGENGAGKSTLVKLLCGFYSPTEGRVTIDGIDLARMPFDEWRARIAAGFQDFVRFELLARESVGVGDLPALDEPEAVLAALERADARELLEGLPSGLDTQLGKSYTNGAELSGGQWQKVALARAMMRAAPLLLILDEPTSSLDAHAEHVLFERYAASAQAVAKATGGVAVFVSHRFSTVRMAELILVMDEGRIVEQGSHEELVAHGGIYAELFALQAAAYG